MPKVQHTQGKYNAMINSTLTLLKDPTGFSQITIFKHILENYNIVIQPRFAGIAEKAIYDKLRHELKSGGKKYSLKQVKCIRSSRNYKLGDVVKPVKKVKNKLLAKKVVMKTTTKKVVKKTGDKKVPNKTVSKKIVVKKAPAKKAATKATPKIASKKSVAKKTFAKKPAVKKAPAKKAATKVTPKKAVKKPVAKKLLQRKHYLRKR